MNIVFIGLTSSYTPGMNYQDNELCRRTVADGHNVTYISNTERYENGVLVSTEPENTLLPDGLHLIRLPFEPVGPSLLTKKVRKVKGLYELLEQAEPEIIFSHNIQYWSVLDVIRYKKAHPQVRLYADSHVASYNSGTNALSLHVLHRMFYRHLARKLIPYLEKFFYVEYGMKRFAMEHYGVPEALLEFYPLGGEIPLPTTAAAWRDDRRAELGVAEHQILMVHSGKLDGAKRTAELLRAFAAVPELDGKLAVIGSVPEEEKAELLPLMEADSRVEYLGWKSGSELREYLCACDLYCQPGSVSATMQNAVCCGSAILSYPHEGYVKELDYGNILWANGETEMIEAFRALAQGEIDLARRTEDSRRCAAELLDYRKLAARLYE